MEDIKLIISQNIVELRRASGMTQIELAAKLNYSDKAISKWERGESVPDITVLKAIADLYGVTLDYLCEKEHDTPIDPAAKPDESVISMIKRRRAMITGMSVLLVWVIATLVFIVMDVAIEGASAHWLSFIWAAVGSFIVWLVFNSIWHNRRLNYLIISLLMWSTVCAVHLSVIARGVNIWQVYLLGIPGQMIIALWSVIGRKPKKYE